MPRACYIVIGNAQIRCEFVSHLASSKPKHVQLQNPIKTAELARQEIKKYV